MHRLLLVTPLLASLLVPAAAGAAPVDQFRGTDGVEFTLSALDALDAAGQAEFSFVADPPDGDNGPYSVEPNITAPPVGVAREQALLIGTAIGCGPPAATTVYGTVRNRARIVRATTVTGRRFRLRKVRAPAGWNYGGWVVGRVVGGAQSVERVDVFGRGGKRIGRARFAAPAACPVT